MPGAGGISLAGRILISVILSVSYVLTLHINKKRGDNGEELDRNDPLVIKSRITRISIVTISSVIFLPIILSLLGDESYWKICHEFGLIIGLDYEDGLGYKLDIGHFIMILKDTVKVLILLSVLFIGPLVDYILLESSSPFEIFVDFFHQALTINGLRDLLIGPLTEEIIYTSSIIVTLLQGPGVDKKILLLIPPLLFSYAHIHHAIELHLKKIPLSIILFTTLFQVFYTFLFGIFTNFIFLRTNNTWACFAAHSFCNFMGLPRFKSSSKLLHWQIVYYLLILFGIYGFIKLLYPLTKSPLSLVL